jgi:hypothetical protein
MPRTSTALSKVDLPDLIRRYAAGETTQSLADEAHVHRSTIYEWMLGGIGDSQYHALVTKCLTNRISHADHLLETGAEMTDIVRAREMAKFSRMDLERRRPNLYGPRHAMSVDNNITVTVQRSKRKAQAVDAKPLGLTERSIDITPT